MTARTTAISTLAALAVMALSGCASRTPSGMPEGVASISLPGEWAGHLQDVWNDGEGHLYWAETHQLIKTDLAGNILKQVDVQEHHAGLQVRDGRVYVAKCLLQNKTGRKTTKDCFVTVTEYDAETLELIAEHKTDINDRSGSLAILEDGTFLIGCLRPQDISATQVRFHHLDQNFKLIKSYVLDNVPVKLGIEVIKLHGNHIYLCMYAKDGLVIKLDRTFKEVDRFGFDAACGLVFDGDSVWTGRLERDPVKQTYRSSLVRRTPPQRFF